MSEKNQANLIDIVIESQSSQRELKASIKFNVPKLHRELGY